jgi:hypothetical protein
MLKTSVGDLLTHAGLRCRHTEEALVALVGALADVRDEGGCPVPRLVACDHLEGGASSSAWVGTALDRCGSAGLDSILRAMCTVPESTR